MSGGSQMTAKIIQLRSVVKTDALIPEGEYEAALVDHETGIYFFGHSPKVVLWWRIVTMGAAFEIVIPGYYAVRRLTGKGRRRGRFQIGLKSRLARDLALMTNNHPPLDHVPLDHLQDHLFRIAVRTVSKDSGQKAIPDGAHYSVVHRVLGAAK